MENVQTKTSYEILSRERIVKNCDPTVLPTLEKIQFTMSKEMGGGISQRVLISRYQMAFERPMCGFMDERWDWYIRECVEDTFTFVPNGVKKEWRELSRVVEKTKEYGSFWGDEWVDDVEIETVTYVLAVLLKIEGTGEQFPVDIRKIEKKTKYLKRTLR